MKRGVLFAVLMLFVAMASSQTAVAKEEITVSGTVLDSTTNDVVSYATIKVFRKSNPTTEFKVFTSDSTGAFSFHLPTPDEYRFVFSSVRLIFTTLELSIASDQDIDMGEIWLNKSVVYLNDVVISAAKPLIKVESDRISYSIADDPDSKTSTLMEMMQKVPMLSVDGEDEIKLKGGTKYKILMDGKPTDFSSEDLTNILKSTQASTIQEVQVITDPGAKYDADGLDGIINIITNKSSKLGGYTVSFNTGIDHRGGYNLGAGIRMQYDKLGIDFSGGYYDYKSPNSNSNSAREAKDQLDPMGNIIANPYKYLNTEGGNQNKGQGYNLRGKITYEFDSLRLLSFTSSGYLGNNNSENISQSIMRGTDQSTTYAYRTIANNRANYGRMSYGADYQRVFASNKDRILTMSYQYSHSPNDNKSNYNVQNVSNYHSYANDNISNGNMQSHMVQVDFTTPIAKSHVIEAGLKYTLRINQSNSEYHKKDTIEGDTTTYDNFLNKQHIFATYLSYRYSIKKWSFRAGVRLEHTSNFVDYSLKDNMFDKSYTTPVPSVSVSFKPAEMQTIRGSYNMRLWRPGIWQLNPYNTSTDSNYVSTGNPNLNVEKNHNFSLGYDLSAGKFYLSTSLSYEFTNNSIENVSTLLENVTYSSYDNIGSSQSAELYGYVSWSPISKLTAYANFGLSYDYYAQGGASEQTNEGFRFYFYGGANYTLPWNIRLGINGAYQSPSVMLQGKGSAYYYFGANISKSFLKKENLTIRLSANNPFIKPINYSNVYNTPTYSRVSNYYYDSTRYGLSVSFRFGEMKVQIKEARRGISGDDVKSGGESGNTR